MVTTQEDLQARLSKMFSETPTDDEIKLMEDFTDTFSSMSADGQTDLKAKLDEATKSISEWEQKFNDNDNAWRKRYTDRFNGKSVEDIPEVREEIQKEAGTTITIDDLFTPHN